MRTAFAAVALLLLILPASAQQPQPDNARHLTEMAWLVGSWKGTGKMHGQPFTDEVEYRWMLNKNFIRSRYVARMGGKVVWTDNTTIAWDRAKKKLVWFTFGLDGSIGGGEYAPSKKKDEWTIYGSINSDDKNFRESRSIMKRVDADSYTTEIQTKKDKQWATFMTMTHKRVKPGRVR